MHAPGSSLIGCQAPAFMLPVHRQRYNNSAPVPAQQSQSFPKAVPQPIKPVHGGSVGIRASYGSSASSPGDSSSASSSASAFNASQSESGTPASPVSVDSIRAKAEASRLVPITPPQKSKASSSIRSTSSLFRAQKSTETSRFWIPEPPSGPTHAWVEWVKAQGSEKMPPSVITKALRALTRPIEPDSDPRSAKHLHAHPDSVLDAVHALLKLSVAHEHANPEMVLEQVARSHFVKQHLPKHAACYNAALTLFTRAASAARTFSDPLSVSQLAVGQVRLQCTAPLFWEQLSGPQISQIDGYRTPQIVNLVWAAAKLNVEVPEQLMLKLHTSVLRVLPDCNDRNLATLSWAYAKNPSLRFAKKKKDTAAAATDVGGAAHTDTADSITTQGIPDTAYEGLGGASVWITDPSRAVSDFAVPNWWTAQIESDLGNGGSQQPHNGSHAAGKAPFDIVWQNLLDMIQSRAHAMEPRALSTVLWSLGSMHRHDTMHAAHAVARHALAAMPSLNAHETANVAWACARLQIALNQHEASELLTRVAHHCMPHMRSAHDESTKDDDDAYSSTVQHGRSQDAVVESGGDSQPSNCSETGRDDGNQNHRTNKGNSAAHNSGFTPQGFANSVWALGVLRADSVATGGTTQMHVHHACATRATDTGVSSSEARQQNGARVSNESNGPRGASDESIGASDEREAMPPKATLCAALITLLPRLSPQELSTALVGLSKLKGRVVPGDMHTVLTEIAQRVSTFSAIELSAILCAAARLRARWGVPQETLLATFISLTSSSTSTQYSKVSGVAEAVNDTSDPNNSTQNSAARATNEYDSAAPPQATANVAWALAKSRGYVLDDEGQIEAALGAAASFWGSQELSNVLWALSTCGHSVSATVKAKLSAAARRTAPFMNAQEVALTLTGVVKTRIGLDLPDIAASSDVWGGEDDVLESSQSGDKGGEVLTQPVQVAEVLQDAIVRCWGDFTPQTAAAVSWAVSAVHAQVSDARVARAMRAALASNAEHAAPMEAAVSLHSAVELSHAAHAAAAAVDETQQRTQHGESREELNSTANLVELSEPQADCFGIYPEVLDSNGRLLRRLLRAVVRSSDSATAVGTMCSVRAIHRLARIDRSSSGINSGTQMHDGGVKNILEHSSVGREVAEALPSAVKRHIAVLNDVDVMHAAEAFVMLKWQVPSVLVDRLPHDDGVRLGLIDSALKHKPVVGGERTRSVFAPEKVVIRAGYK